MSTDERVPWYRVTLFEATSRALYQAGQQSENPLIRDAFAALEFAGSPRPDDRLTQIGASAFQIEEVARLHALDGEGTRELREIVTTQGCSARHGAILRGGALQRQHEISKLQRSLDHQGGQHG